MGNAAQKRATQNYRARPTQRGLTRFEIMALESDRELIRTLARRLAEEGPKLKTSVWLSRQPLAASPRSPEIS